MPRGERGFGWDKIFKPKGYDKTLGEMSLDEKNKISMRKKALVKLKNYLAL
jgi:XTP/dITP diphosphohydrolase